MQNSYKKGVNISLANKLSIFQIYLRKMSKKEKPFKDDAIGFWIFI